jgi:hypothetical protein
VFELLGVAAHDEGDDLATSDGMGENARVDDGCVSGSIPPVGDCDRESGFLADQLADTTKINHVR